MKNPLLSSAQLGQGKEKMKAKVLSVSESLAFLEIQNEQRPDNFVNVRPSEGHSVTDFLKHFSVGSVHELDESSKRVLD